MKSFGKIPLVGMCIIFTAILISIEGSPLNNGKSDYVVHDMSFQSLTTGGEILSEPVSPDTEISGAYNGSTEGVIFSETVPPDTQISGAYSGSTGGVISSEPAPPDTQISGLIFPVPCAVTQFIRLSCTASTNVNPQITEFCTCTVP